MLKILVKYTKNKPKYLYPGLAWVTCRDEYIIYFDKFFIDLQFVVNLHPYQGFYKILTNCHEKVLPFYMAGNAVARLPNSACT
jgi:hypothetical protein